MSERFEKEVRFDIFCQTCKYRDLKEFMDPCNECLDYPVNENTAQPVCYKEKDKT